MMQTCQEGACCYCYREQWDWVRRCRKCKAPCCEICQSIDELCPDCEEWLSEWTEGEGEKKHIDEAPEGGEL